MAYVRIAPFAHGNIPVAATFNQMIDNLDAIKVLMDAQMTNPASPIYDGDPDDGYWLFTHLYRYLRYEAACVVTDPTNGVNSTTLPDTDDALGVYDLEQVSWLHYGMTYAVDGAGWAFETAEP